MAFDKGFRPTKRDIIEIILMLVGLAIFVAGFRALHSPDLWTGKNNNALTGYFFLTISAAILWLYALMKFLLRHGHATVACFVVAALMAYASSYKVQKLIKAKYFKDEKERAVIIKPQSY